MNSPFGIRPIQATAVSLASRSIASAAIACVFAIGLVVGAYMMDKNFTLAQQQSAAELESAELALQNTQIDRTRLEENLQVFERLKKSGFVSSPDRLRILETLENAVKNMRRTTISWEMAAQQNQKPLNDDKTSALVAQLVSVPMKLSVEGVHEEEWLTMLARLQDRGAGFYAVNSCVYEKSSYSKNLLSIPAINVTCNLSWLFVIAEAELPKTP